MSTAISCEPAGRWPNGEPRWPKAVLWDMDGTLVDTEPYWFAAEFAAVRRWGGSWSVEQARALIGSDLLDSAHILRAAGVDADPVEIVEFLVAQVVEGVGRRTTWRPGARDLLVQVGRRGIPQALVTMSWADLGAAVVGQLPAGTFASVVTGDRVARGKPHPDPYLLACEELGVDPGECVAIEDSPTGVASAQAAGVWTIAVPHQVGLDPAPGRRVVPTLAGLAPEDLLTGT